MPTYYLTNSTLFCPPRHKVNVTTHPKAQLSHTSWTPVLEIPHFCLTMSPVPHDPKIPPFLQPIVEHLHGSAPATAANIRTHFCLHLSRFHPYITGLITYVGHHSSFYCTRVVFPHYPHAINGQHLGLVVTSTSWWRGPPCHAPLHVGVALFAQPRELPLGSPTWQFPLVVITNYPSFTSSRLLWQIIILHAYYHSMCYTTYAIHTILGVLSSVLGSYISEDDQILTHTLGVPFCWCGWFGCGLSLGLEFSEDPLWSIMWWF